MKIQLGLIGILLLTACSIVEKPLPQKPINLKELKEAKKYYHQGKINIELDDLDTAIVFLKKSCDLNYGDACSDLGRVYINLAPKYHYQEGVKYYKKGVEALQKGYQLDSKLSYCDLGYCYEKGRGGLRRDYNKAKELYEKSCNSHYSIREACYNLSTFYESNGKRVRQNLKKAYELSTKACHLGYKKSCYRAKMIGKRLKDGKR